MTQYFEDRKQLKSVSNKTKTLATVLRQINTDGMASIPRYNIHTATANKNKHNNIQPVLQFNSLVNG